MLLVSSFFVFCVLAVPPAAAHGAPPWENECDASDLGPW